MVAEARGGDRRADIAALSSRNSETRNAERGARSADARRTNRRMSEHNWFEVVIVNSYPVLVVVGLLILCSCLCGCWQSCERSLGAC